MKIMLSEFVALEPWHFFEEPGKTLSTSTIQWKEYLKTVVCDHNVLHLTHSMHVTELWRRFSWRNPIWLPEILGDVRLVGDPVPSKLEACTNPWLVTLHERACAITGAEYADALDWIDDPHGAIKFLREHDIDFSSYDDMKRCIMIDHLLSTRPWYDDYMDSNKEDNDENNTDDDNRDQPVEGSNKSSIKLVSNEEEMMYLEPNP